MQEKCKKMLIIQEKGSHAEISERSSRSALGLEELAKLEGQLVISASQPL